MSQDQPFIHMEKQLVWSHKLGGAEALGISKMGQTVLARLMESQILHHPTGSVGEGLMKGIMTSGHLQCQTLQFLPVYH